MNEHSSPINWYPGHMAKTRRLLKEQIKRIDLVIEICDARLPYSSRNPELTAMIRQKKHLLFHHRFSPDEFQYHQNFTKNEILFLLTSILPFFASHYSNYR